MAEFAREDRQKTDSVSRHVEKGETSSSALAESHERGRASDITPLGNMLAQRLWNSDQRRTVSTHSGQPLAIRTKVAVGAHGDSAEREADAAADRVIAGSTVALSPSNPQDAVPSGLSPADVTARELEASAAAGMPIGDTTRIAMETAFRTDLGGVRIHSDTTADRLAGAFGARAFVWGRELYFRSGEFQPQTLQGRALLAHELAHVVQEGGRETVVRRQPPTGGGAGGTAPTRLVYIDANVLDQINRGNRQAAQALQGLLASGADVRVSPHQFDELVTNPLIPRTAAAKQLMLRDLNIRVGPRPTMAQRVDVAMGTLTQAGRNWLSPGEQRLVASARGTNPEVWSFDGGIRDNARNIERQFGVSVAPESLIPEASAPADYRVGRRLLGLPQVDISLTGLIRGPSPGGGGTGGGAGGAPPRGGGAGTPPPSTGGAGGPRSTGGGGATSTAAGSSSAARQRRGARARPAVTTAEVDADNAFRRVTGSSAADIAREAGPSTGRWARAARGLGKVAGFGLRALEVIGPIQEMLSGLAQIEEVKKVLADLERQRDEAEVALRIAQGYEPVYFFGTVIAYLPPARPEPAAAPPPATIGTVYGLQGSRLVQQELPLSTDHLPVEFVSWTDVGASVWNLADAQPRVLVGYALRKDLPRLVGLARSQSTLMRLLKLLSGTLGPVSSEAPESTTVERGRLEIDFTWREGTIEKALNATCDNTYSTDGSWVAVTHEGSLEELRAVTERIGQDQPPPAFEMFVLYEGPDGVDHHLHLLNFASEKEPTEEGELPEGVMKLGKYPDDSAVNYIIENYWE